MSGTTKQRILEAAEEMMRSKGFHSVGLSEILAAVHVPKGSFYHYFSSKEQFGVELIQHYVQERTDRMEKYFAATETNALQKLTDYWASQIVRLTEQGCKHSCLVLKLGLEVANFSESMREALAAGLKTWRGIYERVLRDGQADGSIRADVDPAEAAALIQNVLQGASQRTQVERSVAPLRSAAQFLRAHLAAR